MRNITFAALISISILVLSFGYGDAVPEGIQCDPEPANIQYGELHTNCKIETKADTDVFSFSGRGGEKIIVLGSRVTRSGAVCIELFHPSGTHTPHGGLRCGTAVRLIETLEQDGVHTVVVSENGNNATLDYNILVERAIPPTSTVMPLRFDDTISGEIDGIGDVDFFTFNGSPQDVISITGANLSSGTHICIEMYAPDGAYTPNGRLQCGAGAVRLNDTLGQGGIHTIVLSEKGNDGVLAYSFRVQCTPGVCLPQDPPILIASATDFDFGTTNIGSSSPSQLFLISNMGGADLAIHSIALTGGDAAEYVIQNDNCSGQSIPGSFLSCFFEVAFVPLSAGIKAAILTVSSNDLDAPVLSIPISGIGKLRTIGGSVTGVSPIVVACRNETTGVELAIGDGTTSWDCEEMGLNIQTGDRIIMRVDSTAN